MREGPRPPASRWAALALLCCAHLLGVVDVSIVNVALPSLGEELGFSESGLQWVVNAYTLAFGGFLLLGGRAADLLGRRRVFVAGLLVFTLASLACGLAPSAGALVAARTLQGLGGAIMVPSALSIVATTFPEGRERNLALGIFGAVGGLGFTVGVLAGGVITGALGWEWVFFVNVPVGLVAAALAPTLIPGGCAEDRAGSAPPRSFDLAGAVVASAGLAALAYAVAGLGGGAGAARTLGLLALAAALLAAFVAVERRAGDPLVPLGVFGDRVLSGANAVAALAGACATSTLFFVSLHLQQVLGYAPSATGLAFLPLSVAIVVGTNASSAPVGRLGAGAALAVGLFVLALSLFWLGRMDAGGSYAGDVLVPSSLAGLGVGASVVPATIAAVGVLPPDRAGLASGLVTTSQQVGGALGLALLVAVAAIAASGSGGEAPTAGFGAALTAGAGLAAIGAVLALALVRGPARGKGVR